MVTLLARLDVEGVDWIGTSMGGLIGMALAAQARTPIRRLLLVDVGPVVTAASIARISEYVGKGPRFDSIEQAEAYIRVIAAPFGPLTDEQWRHLAQHSVSREEDGTYRLRYDPAIGNTMRVGQPDVEFPLGPNFLSGIDLWSTWAEIRCPTLVLRGADSDVLSHDTLVQMQALRPGVEVMELPGIGHAPALMSYDQIARVKEFLAR